MHLDSVNPASGERWARYPQDSDSQVDAKLRAAQVALPSWTHTPIHDRALPLRRLARLLRDQAPSLARTMALEMGKPIRQGTAEVEKCAGCCDYFADHAPRLLQPEDLPTEGRVSRVVPTPLGIVLAVMPWNFPLWQVFRCLAPTLMAGNALVLKHASNVTTCALAIQDLCRAADLPPGVFTLLLLDSHRISPVIHHPAIHAVTLTGSTSAGRAIAAAAGAALKKTVLELGGSDPYLILEDADLPAAARLCAQARLINSGQSCIAAKRFIPVESVRPAFEELLVSHLAAAQPGDPLDPATDLGPLARPDLRDELHQQVRASIERGARPLLGGSIPPGPGAFYPATALTQVSPDMPVFAEETFGPVAAITGATDESHALQLANQTAFGLGAAVFTRNADRGLRLATDHLEAGACFINTFVRSDPRLPFGGIRDSGYGRELGPHGIREFVNLKTIYAAPDPAPGVA